MEDMSTDRYLKRHGTGWKFQLRVPKDLRSAYSTAHITRPIKAKELLHARRERNIVLGEIEKEFASKRKALRGEHDTLTQDQIKHLAAQWYRQFLEEDDEERVQGLDDTGYRKAQESIDTVEAGGGRSLAMGDTSVVEFEVQDMLESQGFNVPPDTDSFRKLAYAFLQAQKKAMGALQQRQQGEVVETPPALPSGSLVAPSVGIASGMPLSEVLAKWLEAHSEHAARTKLEPHTAVSRFIDVLGDLPVASITKPHIRQFVQALKQLPPNAPKRYPGLTVPKIIERLQGPEGEGVPRLQPRTINKDIDTIHKLLKWADSVGYLDDVPGWVNPVVDGLRVKVSKSRGQSRKSYEVDDLNRIFLSPFFTEGRRDLGGKGEAQFWLPLLALFTGARLEELGQLYLSDVKEEAGTFYIDINAHGPDKHLKNAVSARCVPIHSQLLGMGFLSYVERMRADSETRVFPLVVSAGSRQQTASFSQWWGRYSRSDDVGIAGRDKTFHSFRHTFITAGKSYRIPKAHRDALTGHADGSVSEEYGDDMKTLVEVLAEDVEKVNYPGLDLSHLHTADDMP
ncbi:DUF6538 domain-containing protein [Magnetococcus sp. PR-3]|uniref:DUF6538 domain-containing protein n=1 Tax=Magnetococcus sp. PR-3 TaxID=3120355 RepID=UPI002FCE0327